jgi:creatinine amidohydrolase
MEGDEHAGERETSSMLAIRPDLVKMERAKDEDSTDQHRQADLPNLWTAVSWYSRFPHHYAGAGAAASAEEGTLLVDHATTMLVKALREVKDDQVTPKIQEENYNRQLK